MLSREQVDHVAELARLALTEQERELFRVQLSAILDHFSLLQSLTGPLPTDSPEGDLPAAGPFTPAEPIPPGSLRADEPSASLPLEDVLANAPAVEDDRIRVPVILEERG
jgi:aspartyl-tRNA(Asn)/glutamyl-tRNA(Gln) amidotransferase subunit C